MLFNSLYTKDTPLSDVFGLFERPVYWFGGQNFGTQNTLFKFSFFNCISTNNLRSDKLSDKEVKVKEEETVNKSVFIHLAA